MIKISDHTRQELIDALVESKCSFAYVPMSGYITWLVSNKELDPLNQGEIEEFVDKAIAHQDKPNPALFG
jgi:hypothetical protein